MALAANVSYIQVFNFNVYFT